MRELLLDYTEVMKKYFPTTPPEGFPLACEVHRNRGRMGQCCSPLSSFTRALWIVVLLPSSECSSVPQGDFV